MSCFRRGPSLLAAVALLITGCAGADGTTGDDADSKTGNASAAAGERATREAINALGDDYPVLTWNEPLSADVTQAQLQGWLDDGDLPLAPSTGFLETMLNAVAAQEDTPDVLFLGDSMTQQGIDPQVMGEELSKHADQDVTVFNAASSRARWGVNKLVARYLVTIDHVPDVVVLSLSTRAAERDDYYTSDIAKKPLSSVVEGCDRPPSEHWTTKDVQQCRADNEDLRQRYREAGDQVTRAQEGKGAATSVTKTSGDIWLRSDGFVIHPSVTKKQVQKISDERMERGFPGFPTVHEEAVRDLEETARLLEQHGATVIASELPYTPPHQANLESLGDYDKRRQDSAKSLTDRANVPLFPVDSFGSWWGDGDSRDAIHLAPKGAAQFSRQLVNDTPGFREAVVEGLD